MSARAFVGALLVLLGGCTTPVTELVVVVDTDYLVPSELSEVTIEVTEPSGMVETATASLATTPLPVTLGLTHRGGALGPVGIVVRGARGLEVLVTRSLRTSFARGESRVVRLDLVRACASITCGADQSCGPEGCSPIEVPVELLPPFTGVSRLDASSDDAGPTDGGAFDVPRPDDAPPDANCVFVSATETCDTIDQDCDGTIDEGACTCVPACRLDHAVAICTAALRCEISACDTGFANCDTMPETGCERSVRTTTDCGDCDRACTSAAGTTSCADGTCRIAVCSNTRRGDCDGEIATGCETNIDNDELHCGACGVPCDGGQMCRSGSCVVM